MPPLSHNMLAMSSKHHASISLLWISSSHHHHHHHIYLPLPSPPSQTISRCRRLHPRPHRPPPFPSTSRPPPAVLPVDISTVVLTSIGAVSVTGSSYPLCRPWCYSESYCVPNRLLTGKKPWCCLKKSCLEQSMS